VLGNDIMSPRLHFIYGKVDTTKCSIETSDLQEVSCPRHYNVHSVRPSRGSKTQYRDPLGALNRLWRLLNSIMEA
jgi:hypothetical protein